MDIDSNTKKMIQDYVNILSNRKEYTPEMIKKEVQETFGVPFELEVVQERREAKELTVSDLNEIGGFLPMFKEGESLDMKEWEDKHVFKN